MEDAPLLAQSFLAEMQRREQSAKRFSEAAMARLAAWDWPGNVRELRNAVQRAWVMAPGAVIDEEWLPKPAQIKALAATATSIPMALPGEPRVPKEPSQRFGYSLHIRIGTPLEEIE